LRNVVVEYVFNATALSDFGAINWRSVAVIRPIKLNKSTGVGFDL
jgi:hypothetical protein